MKKLFFILLHRAGIIRLVARWHRKRTVFLCYHSVTRQRDLIFNEYKLHLPFSRFVSHLEYLQRNYNVIPLGEYLDARRDGRALPDNSVILTFDDGQRNFYTVVAPHLVERQVPATAFIITRITSERGDSLFDGEWTPIDDHLYLSWSEVRALAAMPGIEIGSHSHTHPDLTILPPEDVERELKESREAIVANTGNARPALAYPHGRASEFVRESASALGYACAFTGELGANEPDADLYDLRRVVIAGDDDLATFAARVSGVTWWYDRLRAAFRRMRTRKRDEEELRPLARDPRAHGDAALVQMKKPSSESIP
jgi:peptidoglycan/xylan/chitin deacetylase (PgdA/CDA1 family)